MNTKINKNLESMSISDKRLSQFINLMESKTGKRLEEKEALVQAETLLRTVILLYKPARIEDFYSALIRKTFAKNKKLSK